MLFFILMSLFLSRFPSRMKTDLTQEALLSNDDFFHHSIRLIKKIEKM